MHHDQADFIPSERPYKEQSNFRYWTQKVLPLVYDDSLSYYELLGKVIDQLNTVISNSNNLDDNVSDLFTAFSNLQDYVNSVVADYDDYFNNLDLQEEVNNKIDEMFNNGQLDVLFERVINPVIEEQNTYIHTSIEEQNATIANNRSWTESRLALQDARIDHIASLPQGSTSGDAELQDIRIEYNGTVAQNAGSAVRDQVNGLYNSMSAGNIKDKYLYKYGVNRYTKFNLLNDYYCKANGTIESYPSWSLSWYLPVDPNTEYYFLRQNGTVINSNVYYNYFDENYRYLTGGIANSPSKIPAHSTASFIRISTDTTKFTDDAMLVDASLYDNSYLTRYYNFEVLPAKSVVIPNNFNTPTTQVKTISRLGYASRVGGAPEQSIYAYKKAYDLGFRYMLCDLQFTQDGVGVCYHDTYINRYSNKVYYMGGGLVPSSAEIYIRNITYQYLYDNFDFGKYYSTDYENLHVLTFEDMVKFCKFMGCGLYVEIKYMRSETQLQSAIDILKKYNLKEVYWHGSYANMVSVTNLDNKANVSLEATTLNDCLTNLQNLKNRTSGYVFFFPFYYNTITESDVATLINNDIGYETGTINTQLNLNTFFNNSGSFYCKGIESDSMMINQWLQDYYKDYS